MNDTRREAVRITEFMPEDDHITIHALTLDARVGVPEVERLMPQRLLADVTFWPREPLSGIGDSLEGTVDYSAAAGVCRESAARRPVQLIETVADTLCADMLERFPLKQVRVTLRKSILAGTDAVSVTLTRRNGSHSAVNPIP